MTAPVSRRQQIRARYHARRRIRQVCAVLFVLMSATYLSWRLTVFNTDAPILSSLFFAAECVGFLLALCTVFLSWGMSDREPAPVPQGVSVDVFVPTYREPIDVIRRTLEGAVAITYPHRTIVLDDGKRDEIRALAEKLGCVYRRRSENRHAKAGNLNFGLEQSDAEFVMVFDADHIPRPYAIDRLLGYFDDPCVGLAQAPQDFYNLSALQFVNARNGALWHDQSYFYSIILPNSDRFDGGICVGTGVIYRRSALDAIGGIPVETVTEDLHTSLKMHKAGMASAYHPEPVAYGIGESMLSDFYKVRLRWGHGNIHALRHENVLFCRGLSLRQRLNYLLVGLNYLEGWQYLVFYLIPVYSLLTGVPPFEITYFNLAAIIAFPILSYVLVQEFACGLGRFWVNEVYSMIRFPVALRASLAVMINRLAWKPSGKQQDGRIEWTMMAPQLGIVALSIGAIIYAVIRVWDAPVTGGLSQVVLDPSQITELDWNAEFAAGYSLDLLVIAGFWALLNVARGIIFVVKVAASARHTNADHRFSVHLIAEFETGDGTVATCDVRDLSMSFLRVDRPGDRSSLPVGDTRGRLYLPGHALDIRVTPNAEGPGCYSFTLRDKNDAQVLEKALYSVEWHRRLFHHDAEFMTPLRFLAGLIGLNRHSPRAADWRPELAEVGNGAKALRYRNHAPGRKGELTTFDNPPW